MHLGVIPDGNRRYARNKNMDEKEAYRRAKQVIVDIFENLDELPVEIDEATFYLLSEDNLRRGDEELQALFKLLSEEIGNAAEKFDENGFSFNWVSTRPGALPDHLRKRLEGLEERYSGGKREVNALISYSGKEDLVQAAEKVCGNGGEFSRESLSRNLSITRDIDYVIRTGDNPTREALSDFPLWNASYAEYYHVKKHFPAVELEDVKEALHHFKKLRRKKGE